MYWIPIYDILEQRGFKVVLVNARHVKNVPGRKTDVVDCQWIQELHEVGLLRGSFRPSAEIVSLRASLRHRETLVQEAANHIRRMQKSLALMNVHLHNVITDITGLTGMQIVRDIASGVTDPNALASHRHSRCRASEEEIAAALTGRNYRREQVFVLRQNLELYDSYQRQIGTCDGEIESLLQDLAAKHALPGTALPPARRRQRHKNAPRFEIRSPLHQLSGVDLTQIDAIGPYTALRLIAEIGTDMTGKPTTRPRRMTSLRTAVAFREERRPSTLPAHNREHTSMAAHHHVALLLLPMNVQSSSACSSMISKSRNSRWLKRFAAVEARSIHRAMVLREGPVTRAVAAMLTPSTRRLATWSNALRAQRRPLYAVPVCVLTVPPQTVQRYRQRRPHFVGNEPWPTMCCLSGLASDGVSVPGFYNITTLLKDG